MAPEIASRRRLLRAAGFALAAGVLLILSGRASAAGLREQGKDKNAPPALDPYTLEEPEAMKAAGYVRFSPFPLSASHGTGDVEKLLGRDWMLWVEIGRASCRERV